MEAVKQAADFYPQVPSPQKATVMKTMNEALILCFSLKSDKRKSVFPDVE